ncbi:hypothetical protein [Nannocystis pusilla]|uniref:hypothetical protein n=1 Tax=Nannocystis pusilla TaxID=889268 RepID=UPI003DA4BB7C
MTVKVIAPGVNTLSWNMFSAPGPPQRPSTEPARPPSSLLHVKKPPISWFICVEWTGQPSIGGAVYTTCIA